jgi:predicted SprT family Zn-dependent metalloprotease
MSITSERYGSWTVLTPAGKTKYGTALYVCRCDCGFEATRALYDLKKGHTSKCKRCSNKQLNPHHDITGRHFHSWTVLSRITVKNRTEASYVCQCACGTLQTLYAHRLVNGRTKACRSCVTVFRKHGLYKTAAYKIWQGMKKRCFYPRATYYSYYGGRGITICERWLRFENFFADMGERPEGMQIDRIDVNGNYEPGNCRWVTPKENIHNRRISKAQ